MTEKYKVYKNNDVGNSERLVEAYGNDIKFVSIWMKWLIWSGTHYQIDDTFKIETLAKRRIRMMYGEAEKIEDDTERMALVKHAHRSESARALQAMIQLAKSDPKIIITPDQLDQNKWLLNCKNATVDLLTGKPKVHNKADLITKLVPHEYNPDAKCPTWISFLNKIMKGNESLIRFIQKSIGISLTGDTREQCMFILYGSGANGKSTFLETIRTLLNDYSEQTPSETLMMKDNNANSNDIARLKGARFVTASEFCEGKRFNENLIKQLTGGDRLTARFLHKEYFEFTPDFKLWIATNHKPIIKGTDNGIWRRIRLIPFEVSIPTEEQDKELPEKLKGELSGILTWAVEGCLLWQKEGLGMPDEVRNATNDYKGEMDLISSFLNECTYAAEHLSIKSNELYKKYSDWCRLNGENPLTQTKFSLRLVEKGIEKSRTSTGVYWYGLGVLYTEDELEADKNNPWKKQLSRAK